MSPLFMIVLTILSIYYTFYLMRPLNFAKIMPYTPRQAAMLKVVLATVIGFTFSSCLITIVGWAIQLPGSILKS
ncbi:DUF1146 family protein [Eupransor demetentiae]|uniref:DUF1146 domain-containing protein n=1 Tax=Eupransor demetentiae TaxID=3109584 RepID=A0ABP0EU77_9LACO|nr:hypothetical protein R54876_GBNLAHCA_01360 [Lactobacillaceae bacterium LMG 33000]